MILFSFILWLSHLKHFRPLSHPTMYLDCKPCLASRLAISEVQSNPKKSHLCDCNAVGTDSPQQKRSNRNQRMKCKKVMGVVGLVSLLLQGLESNLRLLWFCFYFLCDLPEKLSLLYQTLRSKTETTNDLLARVFPHFKLVTCIYLEF